MSANNVLFQRVRIQDECLKIARNADEMERRTGDQAGSLVSLTAEVNETKEEVEKLSEKKAELVRMVIDIEGVIASRDAEFQGLQDGVRQSSNL